MEGSSVKASTSTAKSASPLETVEMVSAFGSVAGSLAAIALNQLAFAVIPLSASAVLGFLNRKQLMQNYTQIRDTHAAMLSAQAANLALLEDKTDNQQKNLEINASRLDELKQFFTEQLNRTTASLQQTDSNLSQRQEEFSQVQKQLSEKLQAIETIEALTIQTNSSTEQFYYKRGLMHQHFGDERAAIKDFSETIRLNPKNVDAFYNRGILRSKASEKQGAVEDLRIAAKFYFDRGDLEKYQKAKDLSSSLHGIAEETAKTTETSDRVMADSLFS
jgi:tetratricopeptide (TPR) repeat protein